MEYMTRRVGRVDAAEFAAVLDCPPAAIPLLRFALSVSLLGIEPLLQVF